jgi:Ca-activated chloride channel family protein
MFLATACADFFTPSNPFADDESSEEQAEETGPDEGRERSAGEPEQTEEVTAEDPAGAAYRQILGELDAPPRPELPEPEEYYQQILAEHGADYEKCGTASTAEEGQCQRPASLERDLNENINVQLILDASGSMAGDAGSGETKLEAARRVMSGFIDTLPEETNVALRVYGHVGTSDEADREASCAASELIQPFQELDRQKFTEAIESFDPRGWTPVAGSLEEAREDFSEFDPETNSNFVYMVSDGEETCGGDPVAAAEGLADDEVRADVNIVGFDVDEEAARQLEEAAQSAGGAYQEAANAEELEETFERYYDWDEWTAYYNCVWNEAHEEYNRTWNQEYDNYNCLWDEAHGTYNTIWDEAHGTYNRLWDEEHELYNQVFDRVSGNEEYETYGTEVRDLARERRDEVLEAAKGNKTTL